MQNHFQTKKIRSYGDKEDNHYGKKNNHKNSPID